MNWPIPTTLWLLIWTLINSMVLSLGCYIKINGKKSKPNTFPFLSFELALPSLVLGPLVLIVFYQVLNINLIYPVQMITSNSTLFLSGLVPSIVLLIASGFIQRLKSNLINDYNYWSNQPFIMVTRSMGLNPKPKLAVLVMSKSFLDTWNQSLPWLIGEILIVELVFNAPGLFQGLWRSARENRLDTMFLYLIQIVIVYLLLNLIITKMQQKLGELLINYH